MEKRSAPAREKAVKGTVNALNVWDITKKRSEKLIAKEKMLHHVCSTTSKIRYISNFKHLLIEFHIV